jgi:dihydrofolate reductase
MGKLTAFNFLTLDGYYKDANNDISWHQHGAEENEYSANSLKADSILLFGRTTFEMMRSFWPTPMALETNPVVAKGMNSAEKIVFSHTLKNAGWDNTRIVSNDMAGEVKKLKQTSAKDMAILGSGTIITQLAEEGLIDSYQLMFDPVAIGNGTPVFKNIKHQLNLKLTDTRVFKQSGVVLLCYEPA